MEVIDELADILRTNGQKILHNESKLALTIDLLQKLNAAFDTLNVTSTDSFHVLKNTNPSNSILFLHDFIQKCESLKLSSGDKDDIVDLSAFKALKMLELRKVNLTSVKGLSKLRQSLQFLACERGVGAVADVLERCGADETEGAVWHNLKGVFFCRNGIERLDDSLRLVPMLTSLDLAHNAIERVDGLTGLPNLKYLNVGFNRLTRVPDFSGPITGRLQVIILRSNFIDDLQGLSKLLNLTQLDLSDNCLIEHNSLVPLSYLAALQCVNLTGNPLSYHPQHRCRSVQYLHVNTSSVKFLLDDEILTSTERQHIGTLFPKFAISESNADIDNPTFSERLTKIRPAVIADDIEEESHNVERPNRSEQLSISYKEDLSSMHKDYISSLYNKTGLSVNKENFESGSFPKSSTPLEEQIYESIAITKIEETTYQTAQEVNSSGETDRFLTIYDKDNSTTEKNDAEQLSDDDFESGDSNIFLATIKDCTDDIFVMFGSTHLVERDAISTKILAKFSLDSVYLCSLVFESNVQFVYIEFDTIRNVNHRYYKIDDADERNHFFERLSAVVDARPTKEDSLKIYSCLKCSTKFTVEVQNTIHKDCVKCPACGSNLVYEDNDK